MGADIYYSFGGVLYILCSSHIVCSFSNGIYRPYFPKCSLPDDSLCLSNINYTVKKCIDTKVFVN